MTRFPRAICLIVAFDGHLTPLPYHARSQIRPGAQKPSVRPEPYCLFTPAQLGASVTVAQPAHPTEITLKKTLLAAGIVALAACSDATSPTRYPAENLKPTATLATGNNTVIVREADVTRAIENDTPSNNWMLYTRPSADVESGDFVVGPASPPLGSGSFRTVTATAGSKVYLFNYDHIGTALSAIEGIAYDTYKAPGVIGVAFPSINIQIDINGGTLDAGDFRTLVFEPYVQPGFVDATGVWETRDAYGAGNAKWWSTGNANGCGQSTPCSWTNILAAFPGATIVGGFGINQGSGNTGLDASTDALLIAYGGNSVTYDFEDSMCHFTDDPVAKTLTLEGDCETSTTVLVPQDYTLDGNGYTITAVDPAGDHFRGAVIRNAGFVASVIDLTVTASGLSDTCDAGDDRLRGILLEGASGTISGNTVTGVRQGLSGCQEGNAIEARNAPFAGETGSVSVGPDVNVTISGNTVNNYQKNGITVNGAVSASVTSNIVTGDGPITYIAQNGIQIGFGATAVVKFNTASGNNYTPASYESCGLLMYRADGVKASNNTLFSNEKNQCNYGKGSGNVKVTD